MSKIRRYAALEKAELTAEATSFQHEVVEMALSHTIENKVEAVYRCGELLDKRRKLMKA